MKNQIFFGKNVTLSALDSKRVKISRIFLSKDCKFDEKIKNILQIAKSKNIPVEKVNKIKLKESTKKFSSVGFEGKYIFQTKLDFEFNSSYIYILEALDDQNLGAIIRSAEISGITGVIIPKEREISTTASKTSTGAIFLIDIYRESISNILKTFKKEGFSIFAIERGGEIYYKEDLTVSALFIIGGEDKSISTNILNSCDKILTIPQKGKINSLNMSVASSIIMFERLKQIEF